jgi:hypothetical protein
MDNTYSELQRRLAVAEERNRVNAERRTQLMAEMKEEYGCDTVEQLKAYLAERQAELEKVTAELADAETKATEAVCNIERALGVIA